MKDHTITGGGGTRLHLVEAGDPRAPSILFLHGVSQSWLTWDRQLRSELARRYRLIAMDLRGHGSSEQPRDGYVDSRLWAADVDAAIGARARSTDPQRLVLRATRHPRLHPALRRGADRRNPFCWCGHEARQRSGRGRAHTGVPRRPSRALLERCWRERARPRVAATTLLLSRARAIGSVHDAGL